MQKYLFNQFGWLKTLSFKYKLLSCNGQAATKPKRVVSVLPNSEIPENAGPDSSP